MKSDLLTWLKSFANDVLSGLTQDTRPVRIRIGQNNSSPGLPSFFSDAMATPLFVHRFHVREQVCASEPLRLRLLCVSVRGDLSPRALLGQPIQVQVVTDRGTLRTFNAVIVRAQPGQSDGSLQTWLIDAADAMSCMRDGRKTRVFLGKSVLEITEIVFREWQHKSSVLAGCFGYSLRSVDISRYPSREMTIQWNESDSAFLERLWRKNAIGWGVSSGIADARVNASPSMAHNLVLFDDAAGLPANAAGELRYHLDGMVQERDTITMWSPAAQLVPGGVERQSWDYKVQRMSVNTVPTLLDFGSTGNDVARALLDAQVDPPHWADGWKDHDRLTRSRMVYHEMRAATVQGASCARDIAPLTWATVRGKPGIALSDTLPNGRTDDHLFLDIEHWGLNNLPKNLATWVDSLFASNGWPMEMPNIGPNHEERRYANIFTAVARWTPVVPDFDPARHWPSLQPLTAKVVCPEGEEVFCDNLGRVRVQFLGLRMEDNEHANDAGTSGLPKDSAPIRLAQPMASAGHGLIWLPRKNDEVVVSFLGGDPDKPLITGSVYSPANVPASFHSIDSLPGNRYLSGARTREISGKQATHVQHDSTPGQTSLQLHTDHAYAQLNLGYMTTPRVNGKGSPRGEGAELKTDAAASIRAAKGILLSAWARIKGCGNQLDYAEALSLMETGLSMFKSMGEYASQHQGLALMPESQSQLGDLAKNWESGTNTHPDEPGQESALIAITAPQGIVQTSPNSLINTAGKNIDSVAMHAIQQVAGEQMTLQAGKGMSLFAHDGGIQSIAHRGEMLIQSQNANTTVESAQDIQLRAKQDIRHYARSHTFIAEDGSFIQIGNGGITLGTNDAIQQHAASFPHSGPKTKADPAPKFSAAIRPDFSQRVDLHQLFVNHEFGEIEYLVTLKDGATFSGTLDNTGATQHILGLKQQDGTLLVGSMAGQWEATHLPAAPVEEAEPSTETSNDD